MGEGPFMASAELEPITGSGRLCPKMGSGAKPLVRGFALPPDAERIFIMNGLVL